jgi:NhaP-type Na+/H+ or K+/H+ antiporter
MVLAYKILKSGSISVGISLAWTKVSLTRVLDITMSARESAEICLCISTVVLAKLKAKPAGIALVVIEIVISNLMRGHYTMSGLS